MNINLIQYVLLRAAFVLGIVSLAGLFLAASWSGVVFIVFIATLLAMVILPDPIFEEELPNNKRN